MNCRVTYTGTGSDTNIPLAMAALRSFAVSEPDGPAQCFVLPFAREHSVKSQTRYWEETKVRSPEVIRKLCDFETPDPRAAGERSANSRAYRDGPQGTLGLP